MHSFGARELSVRSKMNHSALFFVLFTGLMHGFTAHAAPSFTLQQIVAIAAEQNPLINISKAREDSATASVVTANTFSNPQLEFGAGPTSYRTPGGQGNNGNWGVALSQPLDFPSVRNARREVAENNVQVATLGIELTKTDVRTRVKSAFYDVLQRQAVLELAEADRNLLKDIRERIKLRVDVGESPKYELIKADTESLAAERDYQAARVRITEAKAYLRGLISAGVPEDYNLSGDLPLSSSLPRIDELRERINDATQLRQIRAAIKTSEANLRLQEQLRNPGLTIKAGIEQDPDLRQLRLGIAIPLPLWDQRSGPIAQAAAEVREVNAILSDRELAIKRDIESAYQRYLIAQQQVAAFENGLLVQAEAVLKVAEAAYRFGERGILDYLDAQRTKRIVRKDYLSARYEYINTMLEIERLLGYELLEVKS
jgi:cobalt-zinc-cadmium efflux system outer membrane protein